MPPDVLSSHIFTFVSDAFHPPPPLLFFLLFCVPSLSNISACRTSASAFFSLLGITCQFLATYLFLISFLVPRKSVPASTAAFFSCSSTRNARNVRFTKQKAFFRVPGTIYNLFLFCISNYSPYNWYECTRISLKVLFTCTFNQAE